MRPINFFCKDLRVKALDAFTLVEMLVVVTVIGLLLALAGAGLGGAMQGMAMTNAGNKVTQVIDAARQRAMTANVLTAVVLVTNSGEAEDGRALTVIEYPPGGSAWTQYSEWDLLPEGVTIDLNNNDYGSFVNSKDPLPFFSSDSVKYKTKSLTPDQFTVRVFVPSGGLLDSSQASQLQVVDGLNDNGTTTYTKALVNNIPANYYRVTILGSTGKTKIERPDL